MNAFVAGHLFAPLAFFGGGMGGGEVLVILIVLLLLFGARRLPELARALGNAIGEFRRATGNLTRDIMLDVNAAPSARAAPPKRPPDIAPADTAPAKVAPPPPATGAPAAAGDDFTPYASAEAEK